MSDRRTVPASSTAYGTDVRTGADGALAHDGVLDDCAVADAAVHDAGVRTDLAAVAHHRGALEDRARVQRDVAAEPDGRIDEGLARIEHRHALEQPSPIDAAAQLALGQGQLPAVVDALHLLRIVDGERVDAVTGVVEDGDDVGQVVLALAVVGRDPPQRGAEEVAPEAVDGGVDLLDGSLLRRGVGLLDHPGDEPVLVADQPPVAGGLGHVRGEDRGTVAPGLVEGHQPGQRLVAEQRGVAGDDQDGRGVVQVVVDERGHADHHRVARAPLDALLHERDVQARRAVGLDPLGDALRAVPDHDHGALDVEALEGLEDVHDHRAAADDVEGLRTFGPHARALARRQDDRRDAHNNVLAPSIGGGAVEAAVQGGNLRSRRLRPLAVTGSGAHCGGGSPPRRPKRLRKARWTMVRRGSVGGSPASGPRRAGATLASTSSR